MSVVNPLGWARREIIHVELLAGGAEVVVTDLRSGIEVSSQIVFDSLRNSTWLYFLSDVPPLSTVSYGISVTPGTPTRPIQPTQGMPFIFSNGAISLSFDTLGKLAMWSNNSIRGDSNLSISNDFYYYEEVQAGSNLIGGTVYGFEPVDDKHPVKLGQAPNGTGAITLVVDSDGPLVWQLSQIINSYIVNTFRLFAPSSSLFPPPISRPPFNYANSIPNLSNKNG